MKEDAGTRYRLDKIGKIVPGGADRAIVHILLWAEGSAEVYGIGG